MTEMADGSAGSGVALPDAAADASARGTPPRASAARLPGEPSTQTCPLLLLAPPTPRWAWWSLQMGGAPRNNPAGASALTRPPSSPVHSTRRRRIRRRMTFGNELCCRGWKILTSMHTPRSCDWSLKNVHQCSTYCIHTRIRIRIDSCEGRNDPSRTQPSELLGSYRR